MIGRLRELSEPRLGQQAGTEKTQTPVERDILVQWVRKTGHQQQSSRMILMLSECRLPFLLL